VVQVPFAPLTPEPGVEYFLDLSFRLKEDTFYAPRGFEVAWEQFKLPFRSAGSALNPADLPALTLRDHGSHLTLTTDETVWTLDRNSGLVTSWAFRGRELIDQPLRPHFWRAPTDNDRGNRMPQRLGIWRDVGCTWELTEFQVRSSDPTMARVTVRAKLPQVQSTYELGYHFFGSGDVVVDACFRPADAALPDLPRFGMQMTLSERFDTVTWFGPGPEETYCDRKDARIGLYAGRIAEQFCRDYSEPGESGNKVDVRWAALTGDQGVGLLAVGLPYLSVNALPYATEDLEGPKHPFELRQRGVVTLNLDLKQMGVGGDNSWGARPHEEYRIKAEPLRYRFRLRAFDPQVDSAAELSKRVLPAADS
jgi:beta-galactosidase